MIIELAVSRLKSIFDRKGYKFFEKGNYNLNIIGVRSNVRIANRFDDGLLCVYKKKDRWQLHEYKITTDAGRYWLKNPMIKEKGCALLVPNQYRGVYKLDKHNGQYTALCQRLGNVDVYRDNNRDMVLDFDPTTIDTGMFGINIHRSNPHTESSRVEKWSAGCQVFANIKEYDEFIDICKIAAKEWGNKFSYTLLTTKDLRL
tara:strand:+ start:2536 stop:3141 length:606 start_codon:yes stop_codon:yes gene_type:complete